MPNEKILTIDDSASILVKLKEILGREPYEVLQANEGSPGVAMAKEFLPDLVILDMNMPETDGLSVCRQLKEDGATRDIPIIFLSGSSELSLRIEGFALGAVDYIDKPFRPEEVLARVRTHLTVSRQHKLLARQYAKLQELESMRDNLIHMLVHDMRTPLSGIMYGLEIAAEQVQAEDQYLITMSRECANRLSNMITTIIDLSRLEDGKMPVSLDTCSLSGVAQSQFDHFIKVADGRILEIMLPEHPVLAIGDIKLTERVIGNLLSNAIKFTPKGKGIRICVFHSPDGGCIEVWNEGKEIPLELQSHIFEKFAQAKETRTVNSSGIGLNFCKLAMEAQGGTIRFKSNEGGTSFSIVLPLAASGD